jgi:DNA-binding NtrC family response regulator
MASYPHFPTILVVRETQELLDYLVLRLQCKGYIVLSALSATNALEVVRTHSRAIHLLVTDEGASAQAMAAKLKCYASHLEVLFLTSNGDGPKAIEMCISRICEALEPPVSTSASFEWESGPAIKRAAAGGS